MIQPEYDLLIKIASTPRCSDDDLTREEHLYLKNCCSSHWVQYLENRFFWVVTDLGNAAMLQFEYQCARDAEREAKEKRQQMLNNLLLVATFIVSLIALFK